MPRLFADLHVREISPLTIWRNAMQMTPRIPGVSLEVYKEHRQLTPETDGYLGQLWSGSAVVLAVIDPDARPTMGIFRDGCDHYIKQKDWLSNPTTQSQQRCHDLYLAGRTFADGTQAYGVKMPLRVDENRSLNTVHYPENMLMLAQYYCDPEPARGGYLLVWKVALVSQDGEFFLTVQEAYDVQVHEDEKGKLRIPRLAGHKQLEKLLVANVPDDLQRFPLSSFQKMSGPPEESLKANEGIVERWYAARNMGCIVTSHGPARVHWREVPERPRRRFLVEGERVQFADLRTPPKNPKTKWRKVRKARFKLQVSGVSLV